MGDSSGKKPTTGRNISQESRKDGPARDMTKSHDRRQEGTFDGIVGGKKWNVEPTYQKPSPPPRPKK